ncbi:chemotaxis protein CheB [Salipiger mucosus]|uniref:protein-glutamate O-methyltransferase n=1 Tax=Salipiger mucosus DSM 16094 TaxID=1123237 RepID=S9RPD9_9RHOB|nr:chemotaxis protein CheB [Salipiger mucosus]EPX75894.1 Chemotaxis protein methyltransferase CheR [Salipiger mucosus DSM 16094]
MHGLTEAQGLFIVGITASAGGLEATSLLAKNLPTEENCAYILAQHMSPSHKSMLVQLLSRETTLAVREIGQDTAPEPNTIYIPPSGVDVVYADGLLKLAEPDGHPASPKPSGNRLFKSIAAEVGERAVGIVLSGTGSDGSYGIQAIREAGGIAIAQEPGSSNFDSMPASAIRTGCVDLTLTPEQIGRQLAALVQRPRDLEAIRKAQESTRDGADLFQILLARTSVDFRQYKENTVNRRVHRRMITRGIDSVAEYVELCRNSTEEVDALYRDLLISVTSFFRDPELFRALAEELARRYQKNEPASLRVWVPGCATGEEAYSIAILMVEALGGMDKVDKGRLQVFATDIDEHALAVGRQGTYPSSAVNDIPRPYLQRYFDMSGDRIVAKPKLRNLLMFTQHNVFQDAPFISLDLVSLRNVLIYFNTQLQERVLSRVQYALKSDGLLFLGTSETTTALEDYFVPVSQRQKIFRKRVTSTTVPAPSPRAIPRTGGQIRRRPQNAREAAESEVDTWAQFDALARAVVSDGFLTNGDTAILKIYGDLAPFIELKEPFQGGMTVRVLRKTLAHAATSLVRYALKHGGRTAGQWHDIDGRDFNSVRLVAYPVFEKNEDAPLVLIGFETELRTRPDVENVERSDYLEYLETELSRTKETLTVTIEELQTSNEELQSLNEELQSSNEELQSTNEELETSNEELQSTNEELITVNEELIVNTAELERTTAELDGLIQGLPTQMLMLDQALLIRHASARAVRTFRLTANGPSFGHISQCHLPAGWPSMIELCSQVLLERKTATRQFEVEDRLHTLTVSPLLADNDDLIGLIAVVSTAEMRVDYVMNRTLRQFDEIGTWQVNLLSDELRWSEEVFAIHGMKRDDRRRPLEDGFAFFHEDDREMVKARVEEAIETGGGFAFFAKLNRVDGRTIVVQCSGSGVTDGAGNVVALVGVIRDYTRMRNDDLLLQHFNRITSEHGIGFYSYDIDNDLPYWSPQLFELLGIDPGQPPSVEAALDLFPPDARERIAGCMDRAIRDGRPYDYVERIARPDGSTAKCRATGRARLDENGRATHLYGSFEILEDMAAPS